MRLYLIGYLAGAKPAAVMVALCLGWLVYHGVVLSNADLSNTNLSDADLSGADLSYATNVTEEQLERQTELLEGATMPKGSIHD